MLGSLLKRLLRRAPAAGAMRAQSPRPSDPGWRQEALHLRELGRYRETEAVCRGVLERQPDDIDALNLLGAALLALGEARHALDYLYRAVELAPSPTGWARLAEVFGTTGDIKGAIDCCRRALALQADLPHTSAALAGLLKALGRYDDAEACCRAALQAGAPSAVIQQLLAGALFEQGRVAEAIACIRSSLELDAGNAAAHSDLLRMLNYADAQDPRAVAGEHRAWAERHARGLESAALTHNNAPDPERKLRIGYVSPYFRKHAVTFFLEAVIARHDGQNFELMLYADVARPDEYSERLKSHGAIWRSIVGLSDHELAQMVRSDEVDILVDLSGHTPGNRLLAFARRPAPVQVTWNGYPNTTGMQSMDYRITDVHCDPPGTTEHLHSEKLVRLPSVYMAWFPPADAPEPGPPPALASGRMTFGSFNSCYKLTPRVIETWSRVLARVPGSRLLLLTVVGEAARERIVNLFLRDGIDTKRLDIRARVTHDEFLAAHREVDVALDPFPYNGTTTTCFSLWMGLPVVTLAGPVHASRVGATLLSNLGMQQWIARNADAYVEIAARLASDRPALTQIRAALRSMLQLSPITDGAACARNLEAAYRDMWTAWCRTQCPALAPDCRR